MKDSLYIHKVAGRIHEISPSDMGLILTALRAQSIAMRTYAIKYCEEHPEQSNVCEAFKEVGDRMDNLEHKLHQMLED